VLPKDRFAANLRRLRAEAGISQMELGNRCDMHFSVISRLERGERDPQLATLTALAEALEITVCDLVRDLP
jgi:transcriptional regulator with XRE-family HTH domain